MIGGAVDRYLGSAAARVVVVVLAVVGTLLHTVGIPGLQQIPPYRIDLDVYRERQHAFDQRVWDYLAEQEIGVVWGEREALNGSEDIAVRIDPTIISTDIEHVGVGKNVGADKAIELLATRGITPREWRTLGDSRSDYAMADRLHERGFVVRHGDVRPADGLLERTYPVEVTPDPALTNDAAGAAFLTRWRADVKRGEASAAF